MATIGINNSMTTKNSQDTSAGKTNNPKRENYKTALSVANTLFNKMPDSAGKDLGRIIAQLMG